MNLPDFSTDPGFARKADDNDLLKNFKNQFYISDENTIYLDGNSLGRLPVQTQKLIAEITEKQWGDKLIESWNSNWYHKSVELGDKIARIIGASKGEVIVCDSTSVNLFKLAQAVIAYTKSLSNSNHQKKRIVSDSFNFPTDLYVLQGVLSNAGPGYRLDLVHSKNDTTICTKELQHKITSKTALVVLSLVSFKSSFLYNAKEITNLAHEKGAFILWDLSHAAGAVPIELNNMNADFAIGCTYKFLNGGPGSPAYLYVRKDLQELINSPIQGWFGEKNPFKFELNYSPAPGIRKFLAGTPPVISQLAIEPGIDITLNAGIQNIREKSILQSEYFIFLVKKFLSKKEFSIGSPLDFRERGSHVSLKHNEAYRICQALIHPKSHTFKIIPDFREPNNIRFGITPLYTTFTELMNTVFRITEIVTKKEFTRFPNHRKVVT